jgi:hypothetical protein
MSLGEICAMKVHACVEPAFLGAIATLGKDIGAFDGVQ